MKNVILITAVFILMFDVGFSQDLKTIQKSEVEISGSFEFEKALPSRLKQLKDENGNFKNIPIGKRVTVLYTQGDYVYFSYWYQPDDEEINKELNGEGSIRTVYYMPVNTFIQISVPLYSRFKGFKTGAYTVPVRLRGVSGDFDFDPTISLTANFIAGFGSVYEERSWFDMSFGIGLSSIELNQDNSSLVEENRTAAAFTLSLGALFKPKDYMNFGLFLGWDSLGRDDRGVNWVYDNKPWLGIGINISFNEIVTDVAAKDKNK
ncbi:hypothetical protein ACPUEN_04350 [Algoriphagus yeomjeoni]|uniref:hypothetical protein n=1 Tax=Algoriphagus yeomjeoni TaxID=291403 RepID=UPI003CE54E7A